MEFVVDCFGARGEVGVLGDGVERGVADDAAGMSVYLTFDIKSRKKKKTKRALTSNP